jgi:predicted outer membrane repeat protein
MRCAHTRCAGGSCNLTLTASTFTGCTSGSTGGGVYADANGAPIVLSSVFTANSALTGGGLYIDASTVLTATNLSFVSNSATAGGGALVIAFNASATLQSCSFAQNSAASAGGALLGSAAASVTLAQSSFVQNVAAGVAPHGGAVAFENVGLVSLAGCTFTANSAKTSLSNNAPVGGVEQLVYAGANSAGALFLGAASAAAGGVPMYASIADTTFTACSASGAGGAIAALAQSSPISISLSGATSFVGNTAGTSGGAFAASGAVTSTFTGVTLTGNSAQQDGGAAFLDDGTSTTFTGGAASTNVALGNGGVLRMQVRAACACHHALLLTLALLLAGCGVNQHRGWHVRYELCAVRRRGKRVRRGAHAGCQRQLVIHHQQRDVRRCLLPV